MFGLAWETSGRVKGEDWRVVLGNTSSRFVLRYLHTVAMRLHHLSRISIEDNQAISDSVQCNCTEAVRYNNCLFHVYSCFMKISCSARETGWCRGDDMVVDWKAAKTLFNMVVKKFGRVRRATKAATCC